MKARLTSISLALPDRVIAIGEIVERGVDLAEELFDARVAAKTADLVGVDHEPSPEILAVIEEWRAAANDARRTFAGLVGRATIVGPLADKRAVIDAMRELAEDPRSVEVGLLAQALKAEVQAADEAELQSFSASAGSEAGVDGAASEAGGDTGGPSSPAQNSSAAAADASTDAPQPEAPAPAAEPTPPSTPKPQAQKPARKGAAKGG